MRAHHRASALGPSAAAAPSTPAVARTRATRSRPAAMPTAAVQFHRVSIQPRGTPIMKLYYHPVSTVSRPIVLFAADNGIALEYQVVDLMTGEHMKEPYAAINPSRLVPGARRRRLPPDRELGDPQVSRRQDRFARLSEGPAQARAGQRDDGLAQHRLLPRLRLRPRLSADLSAPQAPERRGAGRDGRVGQGEGEVLARRPRPASAGLRAGSTCAATTSRSPTISARG